MIRVRQLTVQAGMRLIGPFHLQVARGSYTLLIGPSGCGKTTLLEAIAGLRQVHSGRIELRGQDVTLDAPRARGVGLCPQDAVPFPRLTVLENLTFALALRGISAMEQSRIAHEFAEQLALTALLSQRADRLSGGEAARVALGRAAAHRPDILLLDEPMAALDDATRDLAQAAITAWRRAWGCTILHVTHHVAGPLPDDRVIVPMKEVLADSTTAG